MTYKRQTVRYRLQLINSITNIFPYSDPFSFTFFTPTSPSPSPYNRVILLSLFRSLFMLWPFVLIILRFLLILSSPFLLLSPFSLFFLVFLVSSSTSFFSLFHYFRFSSFSVPLFYLCVIINKSYQYILAIFSVMFHFFQFSNKTTTVSPRYKCKLLPQLFRIIVLLSFVYIEGHRMKKYRKM